MRQTARKPIAILMTLCMLFSLFSTTGLAADTDAVDVVISDASGMAGSTVTVTLSFENNPGIASFKGQVYYDESLLEFVSVEYNSAFGGTSTQPQKTTSPVTLQWISPFQNSNLNDTLATLTFRILDDAEDGQKSDITLTYNADNVYNLKEENIPLTITNGSVTVQNYIPGDINMDRTVNNKDATRLFQYLADWDVEVNVQTVLDCNGDGNVNNKDATRLFQYLADWDVILYPLISNPEEPDDPDNPCEHDLTAVEAKAATCIADGNIAYWHCSLCDNCFSDAEGKTEIPLESTVLYATGVHTYVNGVCTGCGKQETVTPPATGEYTITYQIAGNDQYLAGLTIENPNPSAFDSDTGVSWLEELEVPGYNFEGWFDGQGSAASRVTSIPAGTARNVKLYAKWTKETYTITFDNSSMNLPSASMTYTVDQKVTLDRPSVDRYVFLGWTTDRDELVSELKPGTTGNMTLHSNWTSKRNLAKPVPKLGDPLIVEDTKEGKILFAYEIGQVENVPLYTIKNLPSAGGVVSVYTETTTKSISTTDASTIAKAIDHVTTDSTAWTLSEDWNTTTHIEDSVLEEHGYDRTTGQEVGKTASSTYTLTTNEHDNTVVKANDGTVATTTQYDTNEVDSRETWESTASLSVSDTESAKYTDSAEVSAEVGVGYGPVSAKVGASASTSTEISSSTTAGATEEVKIAHENTSHSKTGTDTVTVEDKTTATTSDKGWDKSSSSSSSSSSSFTQYEEQTLSERIAKTYTYGQSYAEGGSNSNSAAWSTSTGESDQYSSTVTYFNSEETTEGVSYTLSGETDGSYRLVRAGIVHVFAVVIYDIANAEYSVATYNVLDDETYTYIDYSATSEAKFDDNENGVLPFEIPFFVNDYVNGRIVASEGLAVNNTTGTTGAYSGDNTSVIIPEYISVDNKDDTHSAVTVRNLSADTFRGKSNIKSVMLSNYMREIPDSAFAGCSALQFVLGSEISSIGSYAFDGCTSLGSFRVSSTVTSLGENAFRGVDSIKVTASNLDVVMGAIQSGAKHITINIAGIADQMKGVTLEIPSTVETFELQGERNTFTDLKIKSEAGTTILNGLTIKDSTGIPLEISSEALTLNQVVVESPNYVLLMKGNAPTISLYGTSTFQSDSDHAVVCRNVTLEEIKSNVTNQLAVTGNVLYCGTINDSSLINFVERGKLVSLTESEFEKYIKGTYDITLDANGGTVAKDSMTAYNGVAVGELPVPVRDYYSFDGWYTAASGGEKVTEETVFSTGNDITLYAHWTKNSLSGWVKLSAVPDNATIEQTKYSYNLTSYTTSSQSSLSGWTKYDTKRTSWGATQGPVYYDPSNGSRNVWSEQYVTSSNYKTIYVYYRWTSGSADSGSTYSYDTGYKQEYRFDYQLTDVYSTNWYGYTTYKYWYEAATGNTVSGHYRIVMYQGTENQWVSDNYGTRWYYQDPIYTYYFYKVESLEATTNPSGSSNVSNVQCWVKYREK